MGMYEYPDFVRSLRRITMSKPTVLVVEDSQAVSDAIENILSIHGYPLSGIMDTTEEAIAYARLECPDIILMDVDLNGPAKVIESAGIISQEYGVPVILLTGVSDVKILEAAMLSESFTYLVKPIQEIELIINIEIAVHKNRITKKTEKDRQWRESILDGVIDAVLAENESGRLIYMNIPAATLLEIDGDFKEKALTSYVSFFKMDGMPLDDLNSTDQRMECQLRTPSGKEYIVILKTHILFDPALDSRIKVTTLSDITDEWFLQEKIRFMTFHDSLTGLYNRYFLEEELVRLNTDRQLPISIIMADLNGLKTINDILGHHDGDLLLKACAHQLRKVCRDEDIIARFGGDEFLIFLPRTTDTDVRHIIQRIQSGCQKVITPLGPMSIALGHYTKDTLEEPMQSSIMRADEDMYRNKISLKKNYYHKCFTYVYEELQHHPFEGRQFTNKIIRLMERMIQLRDDINGYARDIRHLGRVYDIGMICLPTRIYRYSQLSEGDLEQVQKHAEMSYKIVNLNPEYMHVADAVLYHHERWDGNGYPYHLKGDEIPILARMLAVVDAYCSMTRMRNYREPLTPQDALTEIARGSGKQYDPEVVELFVTMMSNH